MNRQGHQVIKKRMGFGCFPRAIVLIFSLLQGFLLTGQTYTVKLIVTDSTEKEEIYIAGTFNDWQPGNPRYRLETLDSIHKTIALQKLAPIRYLFKFTRSTWGTVETSDYGMGMDDRTMDIRGDTLIHIVIKGWIDDFVDFSKIPDSLKIQMGRDKSFFYKDKNLDSCIKYATLTYELSHAGGAKQDEIISMNILGDTYQKLGKMDKALELFLSALQATEDLKDTSQLANIYEQLGNIYYYQGDDFKAKQYYREALRFNSLAQLPEYLTWTVLYQLGKIFFNAGQLDSAEFYARIAIKPGLTLPGGPLILLGDIDRLAGRPGEAMNHYRNAVIAGFNYNNFKDVADAYQQIGQIFKDFGRLDSAFYYCRKAFDLALQIKNPFNVVSAGSFLVDLFEESNHLDSAFIYQKTVLQARDSLYNLEKTKQIQNLAFNEQLRRQDIKLARQQFQNKIRIYGLLGILLVFLIIVFMLWRSNRQRQQAYTRLQEQKQATDTQKTIAERMLDELKTTQKQLIQSEKMASLGELTSGIAHEIKNPLNFINNFSELNVELIAELEEQNNGTTESPPSLLKEIITGLKKNSEKIHQHGKRIDSIVKGMLQHSRLGNLTKEAVNINALCEDSLKLAYHGFRSKEKTFNARYETHFDPELPNIMVIPQDLSRAILNLVDNAFYAVHQKYLKLGPAAMRVMESSLPTSTSPDFIAEGPAYQPVVLVRTQRGNKSISITISDNGMGIPAPNLSKIFQPFFTTKPTGAGTGLGLSMAYDIITKAHGGELRVQSAENTGTEFEILLPIKST